MIPLHTHQEVTKKKKKKRKKATSVRQDVQKLKSSHITGGNVK
jgi:hypothetical protein